MNIQESDILNMIMLKPYVNQRIIAEESGHSLGIVNRSLKNLLKEGYIDDSNMPTLKARIEYKQNTTQRAIILAAGVSSRFVPICFEKPKALRYAAKIGINALHMQKLPTI